MPTHEKPTPRSRKTSTPTLSRRSFITLREMTVFAMLAAILILSDLLMDVAMNVEPVSALIMVYTLVYRRRALIPVYLYVFVYLLLYGFTVINLVYLLIWLPLWGVTMLLPRSMSPAVAAVVYPLVCALFGLAFGALYLPGWMVAMHLSPRAALLWWEAGIPADLIHAAGNAAMGLLILPLSRLLRRLETRR